MILYRIYSSQSPTQEQVMRVFSEVQSLGVSDLGLSLGPGCFDIVGQSAGGFDPLLGIMGRVTVSEADSVRFPHVKALREQRIDAESVWEFDLTVERSPVSESALWTTLVAVSQSVDGWYWIPWAYTQLLEMESGRALQVESDAIVVDVERFTDFALGDFLRGDPG